MDDLADFVWVSQQQLGAKVAKSMRSTRQATPANSDLDRNGALYRMVCDGCHQSWQLGVAAGTAAGSSDLAVGDGTAAGTAAGSSDLAVGDGTAAVNSGGASASGNTTQLPLKTAVASPL